MTLITGIKKDFDLLDYIPAGVCVLQSDFTVLFWNTCLEEWTGIKRENILGSDITHHFPHLKNPKYHNRLLSIFEGGPPTIFSSQLHQYMLASPLHDGSYRIQHTTVTPVSAGDGSGFHALLVIQDVTDLTHRIQEYRRMRDQAIEEVKIRRKAEEDLQRARDELELRVKERTADLTAANEKLHREITIRKNAEEELRKLISTLNAVVDNMPEGVVLLDEQDNIVLSNSIGKKYMDKIAVIGSGQKVTSVNGRPVKDFFISERHKAWFEIGIEGPPKKIYELAGISIGRDSSFSGTVLVIKDATVEKTIEERIHSQERLAAVGQLAAGIAHDFNNILTGIIGFADLILSDIKLPDDGKQMVEAIIQNGQRASELIRQILDFSRKSYSQMKPVDLLPILSEFSKFIIRTIPETISISTDYEPGEYIVRADAAKIQQVLTNLTVNARDAMPEGGVLKLGLSRVTVKSGEDHKISEIPDGDWVVLSVTDTGPGIPSENLPHIFEPFFTTKTVGKGTGLGLSQVYGIIKQHDGHIRVETSPGKGGTFFIYLPESREPAEIPPPLREPGAPMGQKEIIMVVEDNESVRNLIRKKLDKLNYQVLTAKNGREALEMFENMGEKISLVITDLVMPEIGGMELSRIIKDRNASVKVIGLSGYPIGSEKDDLLDAGIVECIQKPFKGQTLVEALTKALGKS